MRKKFTLLLVLVVFLIGAAGGCLSKPELSGDWRGTLSSTKNSAISVNVSINNLAQDQNGNFIGGEVVVTYAGQYTLSAPVVEGNTDEWRARIIAQGTVSENNLNLIGLILLLTNTNVSIVAGDTYRLEFTFPHGYGCRGGDLSELIGPYEFKIYTSTAPLGQLFDEGTADITRQAPQ